MSNRVWQRVDITQEEWVELNLAAMRNDFMVDFEWRVGGYLSILWKHGDTTPEAIKYLIGIRLEEHEHENESKGIKNESIQTTSYSVG